MYRPLVFLAFFVNGKCKRKCKTVFGAILFGGQKRLDLPSFVDAAIMAKRAVGVARSRLRA